MLILQQFDVRLLRLQKDDLELVRQWRNAAHVANSMIYREYISSEMQLKWFETINNPWNYYFIIEFEGKKIGVINAKDYSVEKGFGEGGIFIGEQKYEHSFAAAFASLCLLNFIFHMMGTIANSRIRILKDNHRAIQYNKLLGYELIGESENGHDLLFELTKERFFEKGRKLNQAAAIFSQGSSDMILKGSPSEKLLPEINELLLDNPSPMAIPYLKTL